MCQPCLFRWYVLKYNSVLQLAVGLYLVERRVRTYEPVVQVVAFKPFRLVNIISVSVLLVALYIHVKDVLYCILVAMECPQWQFLAIA